MKKIRTVFLLILVLLLAMASLSSCGGKSTAEPEVSALMEKIEGAEPIETPIVSAGPTPTHAVTVKPTATPAVTEVLAATEAPTYTPAPATPNLGGTGGGSTPSTPTPTADPVATPKPQTPNPTPAPTPTPHTHTWVEVTEQKKVVDVPEVPGHFEGGGTYEVMVCTCGAEFTSYGGWQSHSRASDDLDYVAAHGGFSTSIRSYPQTWVEGTAEVSHYETVVIGYKCACGATKSA